MTEEQEQQSRERVVLSGGGRDDDDGEHITVRPLGAGQDVGRSCIIVELNGARIMFDCGMHMGFSDSRRFPDFTHIADGDLTDHIDLVVVTHFHLDHCGGLPYFSEQVGYSGPILMTHPTKAICPLLLEDFRKISADRRGDRSFFTATDIRNCIDKVTAVDLHESYVVAYPNGFPSSASPPSKSEDGEHADQFPGDGARRHHTQHKVSVRKADGGRASSRADAGGPFEIEAKAYYAGHVLGAAMFHVRVGDKSVVYTGDYNMTPDRHLGTAWIDHCQPDMVISESTYATTIRDSKRCRERDFLTKVHRCVEEGGKVLIPVFALGRAQELCILLDAYWERYGLTAPIYFSTGLTSRANEFYRLFVMYTNQKVKQTFVDRNVFDFKHIKPFERSRDRMPGPMVLFATPGMLHTGTALDVFKRWAPDPKNMVILPGYCVAGTVGAKVIAGHKEIKIGREMVSVRLTVEYLSFSAHADAKGIMQLLQQSGAKNVVLVHGEKKKMAFLGERIEKELGIPCYFPPNGATLDVPVQASHDVLVSRKLVENARKLAEQAQTTSHVVQAVTALNRDQQPVVLAEEEAARFKPSITWTRKFRDIDLVLFITSCAKMGFSASRSSPAHGHSKGSSTASALAGSSISHEHTTASHHGDGVHESSQLHFAEDILEKLQHAGRPVALSFWIEHVWVRLRPASRSCTLVCHQLSDRVIKLCELAQFCQMSAPKGSDSSANSAITNRQTPSKHVHFKRDADQELSVSASDGNGEVAEDKAKQNTSAPSTSGERLSMDRDADGDGGDDGDSRSGGDKR